MHTLPCSSSSFLSAGPIIRVRMMLIGMGPAGKGGPGRAALNPAVHCHIPFAIIGVRVNLIYIYSDPNYLTPIIFSKPAKIYFTGVTFIEAKRS